MFDGLAVGAVIVDARLMRSFIAASCGWRT
jgi:hypothetical protein